MRYDVGYSLVSQTYHESYGQGSWRDRTHEHGVFPWDGSTSFETLLMQKHPSFFKRAKTDKDDRNFRIIISSLRIVGELSSIEVSIKQQEIMVSKSQTDGR